MGFYLVPADFAWLSDIQLREVLMDQMKGRLEEAVRDVTLTRQFVKGPEKVEVTDLGNALLVEIKDGKGVALEKGVKPHQMVQLEGKTIPIRTAGGQIIFRKATRLSMILGRWRHPGLEKRERIKGAVDTSFARSAEALIETKDRLEAATPSPRLKDVLGVR